MNRDITSQEIQTLSEYLDGTLTQRERTQVEARLLSQPELQDELEELRRTRLLLHHLPQKRAPRNFFVTPEMLPKRSTRQLFPIFRLASALAGFLLVVAFAGDLFLGSTPQNAAPAYAPLLEQAQSGSTSGQEKSNAPIIVWGTPSDQTPSGILGLGGGASANTQEPGNFGTVPLTTATAPALLNPDLVAPPETTTVLGGGMPASTQSETSPPALAASIPQETTPTEHSNATALQTGSPVQDQYQSGPILGVNPTQGAAEARELNNSQPATFEWSRIDFHILEGSLAFLAVMAGLAAIFFHHRESL